MMAVKLEQIKRPMPCQKAEGMEVREVGRGGEG
jgi:hypothetical protein